ncbi:ABC transporter substrate-binding protein [Pseudenhygromyxa sp. WMMC2535]|uniref:ABC transporter substrate-binding protein n=1 Tax=Pseudenhygromyxa sp. WMMC2535 TaxID=2712867 RepID=UPI0015531457|nr:ABC transporter substrate-binding protein [Pseudenhygromyxa sp. WMMC2535]NVB42704.1 ABC transporter substrate-binding protein [Pseudenhygromyxa sp. WMMC2535]
MAIAGLGASLVGNACSLTLSFDECSSDNDCVFASGNGSCDNGVCVFDDGADEATGTSSDTADTESDTADTESDTADTGTETGTTLCSTHTECVAAHTENWLCGCAGECIEALTPECQIIKWPDDTPQDNVVFVGSIMPTSPPFDSLVLPIQNAMQLAFEDFNDETQLADGQKIAWVGCDSQGGSAAVTAAHHLVDEICVPAIVGPVFSESVIAVAEEVTVPGGVFLISPTATSKKITSLVDDDLVWRPITSDVYQANAIADRVDELVQDGDNVVIVHKSDLYGNDLATDAYAVMPGVDVTDVFEYEVTADSAAPIADVEDHIANTLFTDGGANPPEVIVLIGTSEVAAFVLGYFQAASVMQPPPYPRFVLSHGAVPSMPTTIKHESVIDNDSAQLLLYGSLEGIAPIIFDEQNFAAFNTRYMVKFQDQDAITTSSLSYDAALVTLFAAAAIGAGEPVTGANIAAQLTAGKLTDPDGTFISFGPSIDTTFIKTAVNALTTGGGTVDLKGVSGELDFDLTTGELRTNYLGWEPVAINDNLDNPTIASERLYTLNPAPAEDGNWTELP